MVDYEDQQIELAETGMPAEGSPVDSTTPLNPENPAEIGTDTGTEGGMNLLSGDSSSQC